MLESINFLDIKVLYTVASILIIQLVGHLLRQAARRTHRLIGVRKSRYFAIRRTITIITLILNIISIFLIWKVDLKNAWVSLTGILALVAVGLVAIWSLIGNILAGFLLYFTSPFKIEDTIEVLPHNIKGEVMAINTFFTVLLDEELNYISVPNSLFFQNFIKVLKKT